MIDATKLRRLHEAATPGPIEYGIRADMSIWMSIGNPVSGPHVQADWEFGSNNAELIAYLFRCVPDILAALEDRERLDHLLIEGIEVGWEDGGPVFAYNRTQIDAAR